MKQFFEPSAELHLVRERKRDMHTEHSMLKTLLGEIETLRMKRRRELTYRSLSTWKRFSQQELNDEACPTYKNLLVGRSRRIPDRRTVLNIAEYLECTSSERNDLLLAAGYLPIRTELEGHALELEIERARHTMGTLPLPAMIVTHTQDIVGHNEPFRRLFDLPLDRSYDHLMNRVDLHFHPGLPIRPRSTFDRTSLEQWESHAIRGIQAFKRTHMLSRHEAWYQSVVQRFEKYDVSDKLLDEPPSGDEAVDPTQTILAKMESTGELIPIRFKQYSISAGDGLYPQIQVFLPVDAAAHKVFEELGCPVECGLGLPPLMNLKSIG